MCMQPWFFSMGRLHFGQAFVFAKIQFRFSDSALFLTSHCFTVRQFTWIRGQAYVRGPCGYRSFLLAGYQSSQTMWPLANTDIWSLGSCKSFEKLLQGGSQTLKKDCISFLVHIREILLYITHVMFKCRAIRIEPELWSPCSHHTEHMLCTRAPDTVQWLQTNFSRIFHTPMWYCRAVPRIQKAVDVGYLEAIPTGRCASSLQVKQKEDPQLQITSRGSPWRSKQLSTAYSQSGAGHHSKLLLSSTNDLRR